MVSSEVLAVLADEVAEAGEAMRSSFEHIAAASNTAEFDDAVEPYLGQLERIAAVSGALGLIGLQEVCGFVARNFSELVAGDIGPERRVLFEQWPQLVLGYLRAPLDGVYSRELADWFRRPHWPCPLDEAASDTLLQSLTTLPEVTNDAGESEPARQTEARAEDLILEIPADVHVRLIEAFLSEGPQQSSDYSALMQRIVRGDGWLEELNECRRLIHALKGSANTVGVRGVATLCHHVEDILQYLARNALLPQGAIAVLLVKVADTLEMMFEALLGTGEAPDDALYVLQRVLDVANRMDRGEYDAAADIDVPPPTSVASETAVSERSMTRPEKTEPKVRINVRTIDSMLRLSGELTISCSHVMERMQQTFKLIADLRERQAALWNRTNDMEGFVATQGIAAGRRQAVAAANNALAEFDPLEFDQYNELHTYVHGLSETVADLQLLGTRLVDGLSTLEGAVRQQASLNSEMHDLLMTSRMTPAGQLESRLQRAARQAAEQCGKRVTLRLTGADVVLDDQMIALLIDPLQHLLRNAVDHGIESEEVRRQRGKPETGEVVLSFVRDGKYLVVTCRDDGAGLDLARIYQHAIERGLVPEGESLDDDAVARLILRPGFSTAEAVTQVSGRGVGMDIVHTQVVKLKGSLDIRTQPGEGTTFTLRLPMMLGIAHCLLTFAGNELFALPSDNLEQIVYEGGRKVMLTEGNEWRYRDGDLECPAYFLTHLTGSPARAETDEDRPQHVLLMNDIAGKTAIVVDGVRGGQDLVVKTPSRFLSGIKGLVGASIIGDGSVVPILDLVELLRIGRGAHVEAEVSMTSAAMTDVLVVDDSLSVRTALSLLLAEEGFRVRTAKDGVEAIEFIEQHKPAIVLADLEMPRMNGLELTAHIRAKPTTRDLPVIMITSRTAEKHRKQAAAAGVNDYITKPYRDVDLVSRLRTMLTRAA
jgi:chemotaxis protein histidine kinase CheA/CheY-like chemotaxis protein